ncbi:MAG: phosphatidylglycerophosphatase A, partial [Candidatus Sumerlaeia bacterium]|nr:phosphatidylglycerophosphatase A [Candidatus Sumerlaeia bacterium]
SGTVGSIVGLFLYLLLTELGFGSGKNWIYNVFFLLFLIYLGVWSSEIVARESGKNDPSIVVIDEIIGFFVSVFLLPIKFKYYISAFVLFRLLDVLKPPPAYQSQKLPGGIGILADDIIVGVYTCLILHLTKLL